MSRPGCLNPDPLLAAADPSRLAWAGGLLSLLIVAIVALFIGWLLARWMRLRHLRMTAPAAARASSREAWFEAARRLGADDDTVDLDPPPDQPPPAGPHARWQS